MASKDVVWNNGQRRRLAKQENKTLGKKLAYNEDVPRSIRRKTLNLFVKCPDCGDRLLAKNLNYHVLKALKHKKPKKRDG